MHAYRSSMGDLVSASFPVPDNPILLGVAQRTGLTNLGDLVDAAFPLPQNPITSATSMDRPKVLTPPITSNALVRSLTAAKTGPVSMSKGMGDAASAFQSIGSVLDTNMTFGGLEIPGWALAVGALGLVMWLSGGKTGQSRYQRLRA